MDASNDISDHDLDFFVTASGATDTLSINGEVNFTPILPT